MRVSGRIVFLAHEQDAALLRSHERDRAEALLEPAIEANHEPLGGGDGLLMLGARVDDDAVSLAVPGPREGGKPEHERGEDDEASGAGHARSLLISRRPTSSRTRWSG